MSHDLSGGGDRWVAATCSLIPIVVGGSGVNVVCVHKNLCVQRSTSYVAGTNGRKVQRHNGTRQLDQVPGGPMAQASRRTEVPYLPSWPFRSLTLFFSLVVLSGQCHLAPSLALVALPTLLHVPVPSSLPMQLVPAS